MLRPRTSSSPLAHDSLFLDASHLDQSTRAVQGADLDVDEVERIVADVLAVVAGVLAVAVGEDADVAEASVDADVAGTSIDQVEEVVDDKPKAI